VDKYPTHAQPRRGMVSLAGGSLRKGAIMQHQNRAGKKKARGAKVRNLQQKISLAEVQLQRDLEDEPAREILSVAQGHLADSLQVKVVRNHQLSSATWFRYGDTCSKRLFDFHRIGRKRTPLKELKTEGGDITG